MVLFNQMFGRFLFVALTLAMLAVVFILATLLFGDRTITGRTAPGPYGCYYEATERTLWFLTLDDEDYVCPKYEVDE